MTALTSKCLIEFYPFLSESIDLLHALFINAKVNDVDIHIYGKRISLMRPFLFKTFTHLEYFYSCVYPIPSLLVILATWIFILLSLTVFNAF